MSKPSLLVVFSSAPRGWYMSEFAHPYEVLSPHFNLVMASPKGGATVLDPVSTDLVKDNAYCMKFKDEVDKQKLWNETQKLETFLGKAKDFWAMFDLLNNKASLKLIREFYEAGSYVTAVCHDTVALVKATFADGTPFLAGERVTGFSNAEEVAVDIQNDFPIHLETELNKASGGHYEKVAQDWGPHVVVSSNKKLLLGQNLASARPLALEILKKVAICLRTEIGNSKIHAEFVSVLYLGINSI
ncbi:putative chaperone protein HSP31 [Leptodontidium sp. 2 PMI_412]|nr:putative chaperone protein HSP31 [Leptodontidium sp. 2 PMI_412]